MKKREAVILEVIPPAVISRVLIMALNKVAKKTKATQQRPLLNLKAKVSSDVAPLQTMSGKKAMKKIPIKKENLHVKNKSNTILI